LKGGFGKGNAGKNPIRWGWGRKGGEAGEMEFAIKETEKGMTPEGQIGCGRGGNFAQGRADGPTLKRLQEGSFRTSNAPGR